MSDNQGDVLVTLARPEEGNNSTVQGFPMGDYSHPVYGKLKMNPERAARMAEQVNNDLVGHAISVDYDHSPGKAAGWVTKAEVRQDGLYLNIDWTDEGASDIRSDSYRYLSPEIRSSWKHPRTGEKYKDVLSGIALTNKPFLLDIKPLELSEEEILMNEKLRGLLKLADTASDEQVFSAVEKLATDISGMKEELDTLRASQPAEESEDMAQRLSEVGMEDVAQLLNQQQDSINKLLAQQKLNGIHSHIERWSKGTRMLSQAVLEQAREVLITADADTSKKVISMLDTVTDSGVIDNAEVGTATVSPAGQTAELDLDRRVRKLMDSKKLSYQDALSEVFVDDPKFFEEYQNSSYAHVNNGKGA